MKPALFLSFGYLDRAASRMAQSSKVSGRVVERDIYDFDLVALSNFSALLVSMHADQRFLQARASQIERFLRGGGTVVSNGHIACPFLPGVAAFHALQDYRLEDLAVRRTTDHPIWAGVAESDLTFRRGVAGFYGRGWHQPPDGATVIHTIGARNLPVDFIYQVGDGRVLFHGGNDLWQYGGGDTTGRIVPQLMSWLFADGAAS